MHQQHHQPLEYIWFVQVIILGSIFKLWIFFLFHIHMLKYLSVYTFFHMRYMPRFIKSIYHLRYVSVLKSFYKQSSPSTPPLCLLLQQICGLCKMFEKERIFRAYIGFKPMVFFFKPETVEVVLSSSVNIDKSKEYDFLSPWLGKGLLTSSGTKWRSRRKLLTPSFHFSVLENFVPIFYEQSNVLVEKLEDLSDEPWLDIVPLMANCTLDIICQTAMGVQINAQSGGHTEYVTAIKEIGNIVLHRILRPWLYPKVIFNCTPTGRRFNKYIRLIHDFTRKVIKKKKECMIKSGKLSPISDPSLANGSAMQRKKRLAFLETLLELHLKDPSLTEEDIREEVDIFMFAGHDTTSMALSWTLHSLGLHENFQKEVHEELDYIFENEPDREITREDLSRMKYLECVIKETLRLYPSVPFIGREVLSDFKVLDHTIKRGCLCFIFPYMLHQDPVEFPEPEKFNPERFFPENSNGRHPYAYVPFSAGPRNCIGQKFALMEEKTVLANILRRYRVVSLDHRDKVNITPSLVTRNVQPLRVRFIKRS